MAHPATAYDGANVPPRGEAGRASRPCGGKGLGHVDFRRKGLPPRPLAGSRKSDGGIGPVRALVDRSSASRLVHWPSSGGMVPVSWLAHRYSMRNAGRPPSSAGIAHSSRKQGTVGRPSIRIRRPGIRFGNEVRYGTIRWPKRVPGQSVLDPGSATPQPRFSNRSGNTSTYFQLIITPFDQVNNARAAVSFPLSYRSPELLGTVPGHRPETDWIASPM